MENVQFTADSKYVAKKGAKFRGVKEFTLEDDVLTIEMGNGRKFTSPLNELFGTYWRGGGVFSWFTSYEYNCKYKLYNSKGEFLLIRMFDWTGFRGLTGGGQIRQMFEIIESAPNVKAAGREKIELIISGIALIIFIIYLLM